MFENYKSGLQIHNFCCNFPQDYKSSGAAVNFHIHGKNAGFIVGGYMNVSKYQEFGIRLGADFGKLK
jgi:hypothetical protein